MGIQNTGEISFTRAMPGCCGHPLQPQDQTPPQTPPSGLNQPPSYSSTAGKRKQAFQISASLGEKDVSTACPLEPTPGSFLCYPCSLLKTHLVSKEPAEGE